MQDLAASSGEVADCVQRNGPLFIPTQNYVGVQAMLMQKDLARDKARLVLLGYRRNNMAFFNPTRMCARILFFLIDFYT